MNTRKDVAQLLRKAQRQGYTVDRTSKHIKVRCPDGRIFGVSQTPSDGLALRRIRADLRRHGVAV